MENRRVTKLLPYAYEALKKSTKICSKGSNDSNDANFTIEKAFRGQISSFGAAILTGSLKAAVAFYSVQGGAKTARDELLTVIHTILREAGEYSDGDRNRADLKDIVLNSNDPELREKIMDASVAMKLAMNFFTLTK